MGKIILLCGKICSGKSRYAAELMSHRKGVLLSCDELMFALDLDHLWNQSDDMHEMILPKIKNYFYQKAAQIVSSGCDVILDFGFWSREERDWVSHYFAARRIPFEWHYIHVSHRDWVQNIAERNKKVLEGDTSAYFLDSSLIRKMNSQFEVPNPAEIDVWIDNRRD